MEWHDHGVMGMIKNEKYKGDVLLGKTFTVDPISKRRLANMGEENQYYIRDHHEAIVSREIWDKAEEIRLKRAKPKLMQTTGNRERYTRQFLADSFDDVLQSVLNTIEDILKADIELKRVNSWRKTFPLLNQKSRLTDLLIDGKIEQKDYDEKKLSFQRKLHQITEEKAYLEENIGQQKNISKCMSQLRQTLENENALDELYLNAIRH